MIPKNGLSFQPYNTYLMKKVIGILLLLPSLIFGQSVNGTYDAGDIPTSQDLFDPFCNGPTTTLEITLPPGGPWLVTGIDIEYSMTAQGGGWKSHQRSQIHCQNSTMTEALIYDGSGNNGGIQAYSRNNVSIANGSYAGNTSLVFDMSA